MNKKNNVKKTTNLTPKQYHILFEKGTERPFTGKLLYNKKNGTYVCASCGNKLFSSETKFDSGTGWPSFYDVMNDDSVKNTIDNSLGMTRIEVSCKKCGGHLGHVFDDGPTPTNQRYCINSSAMKFNEKMKK